MYTLQIPNGFFHLWHSYLKSRDIDGFAFPFSAVQKQQLNYILAQPIDAQSSYVLFIDLIQQTEQQLNCPHLIFDMVQHVQPEHFGILGYIASKSISVAEALHFVLRFNRLVIDGQESVPMHLSQKDQVIHLHWGFSHSGHVLINEMTVAAMVQLARQIFSYEQFSLKSLSLAHEPRCALYHYQRFYGCQVYFHQPRYALELNHESLLLKSQQPDPSLNHLLLKHAEEVIAAKSGHMTLMTHLHTLVAEYLLFHQEVPKLEWVAQELHLSVRTLQRQLSEFDSSFKKVIETERVKRCNILLQQKITLSEIALALGYSDQSALARAYKAATGQTLLARRQQYKLKG